MFDSFLLGMHREGQINAAQSQASEAQYEARGAAIKNKELERAVDRLLLINRAMWEIMQERLGVTLEQLTEKVNEIDLRDGALDGRYEKRRITKCESCGRNLNSRHTRCIYCGAAVQSGDVFDTVK